MNEPEYMPPQNEERETFNEIQESTQSTLAILTQSEHAAMVATANQKGNRRSVEHFSKTLEAYATHSQPVALSMFYTVPRDGKQIIGASVRYAEIVAPCWKNNSAGSRLIGDTDKTVTAQGVFMDYENNVRNVKEIPRRITDKNGNRFKEDMILTTAKAALSVAYRESILKGGVPMALWLPPYEQAKLTAVGKAVSHSQRIDAAMEYMNKLGVTEWQIMNAVECPSPKDLTIDQILTLRTLCEEIKQGKRTIDEVFGSEYDKEIEAIFVQLKTGAAERNLMRTSYRGRPKDLLEYLKGKLPSSARQATTEKAADKPDDKPTGDKKDEPPAEKTKASGKGRTKNNAEQAKEPETQQSTATQTEAKKDEAPPATSNDGQLFNDNQDAEPADGDKYNF